MKKKMYCKNYGIIMEIMEQLPECQGTPCSKQARNLKFK